MENTDNINEMINFNNWKKGKNSMEDNSTTFSIRVNAKMFERTAIKEYMVQDKKIEGMYSLQKRPFIKQVPLWVKYYWRWYIVKLLKRKIWKTVKRSS